MGLLLWLWLIVCGFCVVDLRFYLFGFKTKLVELLVGFIFVIAYLYLRYCDEFAG